MAEVIPSVEQLGDGLLKVTWTGLAGGDTGRAAKVGAYPRKTVQATGDATSVVLQGSNDGTNFAALPTAVDLDATADEIAAIAENTLYVNISSVTAGSDTDVTIIAATHR